MPPRNHHRPDPLPVEIVTQQAIAMVEGILRPLFTRPDLAKIEAVRAASTITICVRGTDRDCGIAIGKGAVHRNSIQGLLNALASKNEVRIIFDIDRCNPVAETPLPEVIDSSILLDSTPGVPSKS